MTDQPTPAQVPLLIRKPCPKSWGELVGDEKQRFCSECSLHVHNAAQLSKHEAEKLVAGASARVCMRIEYDASGAPMFRDSQPARAAQTREHQPVAARLTRWALSAAAGLLAACHGSVAPPAGNDPAALPNGGETPSKMGNVTTTLLGDVATPQQSPRVMMGEAVAPENSTQPPTPENPPVHEDK